MRAVNSQDLVTQRCMQRTHFLSALFFVVFFFRDLANHHVTSKCIQLLQFKQLFIKRSSQRQTSSTSKYITFHQDKIRANRLSSPLSGSEQRSQQAPRWRVTGRGPLLTWLGIPPGHETTEERARPLRTLRTGTACPPVPQTNPHPLPQPPARGRRTVEPGLSTATRYDVTDRG